MQQGQEYLLTLKNSLLAERQRLVDPIDQRLKAVCLLLESDTIKLLDLPRMEKETWLDYTRRLMQTINQCRTNELVTLVLKHNTGLDMDQEMLRKVLLNALKNLKKLKEVTTKGQKSSGYVYIYKKETPATTGVS